MNACPLRSPAPLLAGRTRWWSAKRARAWWSVCRRVLRPHHMRLHSAVWRLRPLLHGPCAPCRHKPGPCVPSGETRRLRPSHMWKRTSSCGCSTSAGDHGRARRVRRHRVRGRRAVCKGEAEVGALLQAGPSPCGNVCREEPAEQPCSSCCLSTCACTRAQPLAATASVPQVASAVRSGGTCIIYGEAWLCLGLCGAE